MQTCIEAGLPPSAILEDKGRKVGQLYGHSRSRRPQHTRLRVRRIDSFVMRVVVGAAQRGRYTLSVNVEEVVIIEAGQLRNR